MTWVLDRPLGNYLLDAVVNAYETASIDELVNQFRATFAQFGVTHFSFSQATDASGRATAALHFGSRQPEWTKHYRDNDYAQFDPLLKRTLTESKPFLWSDPYPTGKQGDHILGEAGEHGLKDGLIVPLHSLDGSVSGVLLTSDQRFDLSPEELGAISMLATFFATRGQNLAIQAMQPSPPQVQLTKRQRECLQWTRSGLRAWEISEKLGISENMVREHLESARRRLGVTTTHQAVIEAIAKKLIWL